MEDWLDILMGTPLLEFVWYFYHKTRLTDYREEGQRDKVPFSSHTINMI